MIRWGYRYCCSWFNPTGLLWLENDGFQNFVENIIMSTSPTADMEIVDLDDDGDLDILSVIVSSVSFGNRARWFENDGKYEFYFK